MASELRLTIPEIAASIQRTRGVLYPDWKLRRVVDDLESRGIIDIQRVCRVRTVSSADVNTIADDIEQSGFVSREAAHVS